VRVRRALRTSFIVGTALTIINLGHTLVHDPLTAGTAARIVLNYTVPFLVALYSMLGAVPEWKVGARPIRGGTYKCRRCANGRADITEVEPRQPLPACPTCGADGRWVPAG
jgi:hypothetical protein